METSNCTKQIYQGRLMRGLVMSLLLNGFIALLASYGLAAADQSDGDILENMAPQGFGDRQNSWAWSMVWWNDYLYVGTNRAWHCAEVASFNSLVPNIIAYPPDDPDIECTSDPRDLPMQAEIWRWSAADGSWEMVYRSPRDVPLDDEYLVSRDIGYRGMLVFEEPDGTEALYVGGVSPRFMNFDTENELPPPRILRSTDGVNFAPVPQDPGTVLGDFPFSSFRNQISFNGKFYIIGGNVQGSGVLLEAENPAAGNDAFRQVSPPGTVVSAMAAFNGRLYLGLRDAIFGYQIASTEATGRIPYSLNIIVERGGYAPGQANSEVLHMTEFQNRLYIGGNGLFNDTNPAELIRINPDESWDLLVGTPRLTPDGLKRPLSGMGAGFNNPFNGHMWRLEEYNGELYVGTFDASTVRKDEPAAEPFLRELMGFDLYRTSDGVRFSPVTLNGFGDRFNFGVRALQATPYGLFIGTANYYYGLQIWRFDPETPSPGLNSLTIYLPLVQASMSP